MSASETSLEIIFETIRCGNSLKVSAIDVASAIEVSIVAPLDADKAYTQAIVARKLERRLSKASTKETELRKQRGLSI